MKSRFTQLFLLLILVFLPKTTVATFPTKPVYLNEFQSRTLKAFVLISGQWIQGWVTYSESSEMITKAEFPDAEYSRAYFLGPLRPSQLNADNALAVAYNFTHYIDISTYGRAYFQMD